jgi:hypothetical protein
MVREKLLIAALFFSAVLLAVGCGPSGALKVKSIQTGRSLNSDNSVGVLTQRFRPDQTMYAAVLTDGPGKGTLTAKWTYAGRTVSEDTKKVSYRDSAATEFHITNSSGFPPGDYSVEILLDGKSVETRNLKVEKEK